MDERDETGLYLQKYTDDKFILALRKALETPTVTASEVAAILGCNQRYAVNRLVEMAESGKINAEMKGRAWGFRPFE